MPWSDSHLPFSGLTPQSRQASYQGAQDATQRAPSQVLRYLEALRVYGPLTDAEAAAKLGIDRSSINARRADLVRAGIVGVAEGIRRGPTGVKNTRWTLL